MVIDMNLRPPVPEFFAAVTELPKHMSAYANIYSGGLAFSDLEGEDPMGSFLRDMKAAGIDYGVCALEDTEVHEGGRKVCVEFLAEFTRRYPQFIGFMGLNPRKGRESLSMMERAVRECNVKGFLLVPFEAGLYTNDKHLYPFYARCEELEVPMLLHSSMNFSTKQTMYMDHPMYIDEVACDFPDLKIIAANPGFPWVSELVAVAWRHPNVYIGTSAVRAKYLGVPGAGYETLLHAADSTISNKMIYASSYPLLPFERNLQEARALPLKEENMKKFLGGNLARLLGLEEQA